MPVKRRDYKPLEPGDYYVNVRANALVEVMHVDPSGNPWVLNAVADLEAPWQKLSHAEIYSRFWRRVARDADVRPQRRAA